MILLTFFFFKILLTFQRPLQFHVNFMISSSIPAKVKVGILIRITVNLQFNLGIIDIVITLSLPIHEYRMSLHLFRSLISFNNVLQFLVYKFYISLVKFIHTHIPIFDDIITEIIFSSFKIFRLLLYYSCPNFSLLALLHPYPHSHSQFPPCCPCPWSFMHAL